jgi:Tol biopolymer transport system component
MDGKRYGDSYDGIKDPVLSPDGSLLAFAARKGDKHHVVLNGIIGPPYDMVVAPQFSPDGSRLIYRVRQEGKRFVVVADTMAKTLEEQPRYDLVWQPVFASDGKSIAYAVKLGKEIWWKVEPLK